jgi:hypothetical protein
MKRAAMNLARRRVTLTLGAVGLAGTGAARAAMPAVTWPAAMTPLRGLTGADLSCDALDIEGDWPRELRGALYRNGPALYERDGQRYRHWFDGDGMVQAFRCDGRRVSHRGRFVRTPKFNAEQAAGRFMYPAFGTAIAGAKPVRSAVPHHHPAGAVGRAGSAQRRRAGGAEAQDPVARRHHAPGDESAGVHAAAGRQGDRRAPFGHPCRGRGCISSGSTACWPRTPGGGRGWCHKGMAPMWPR